MKKNDFVIGKPIPQPDRNADKDLLKVLFFSILFAIPLLIYVAMRVNFTNSEIRISDLIRKKEELKRQKEVLLIERERLLNLANAEKIALEKLGMIKENPSELNLNFSKDILKKNIATEKENDRSN
jgi:hypothetical protein